MTHPRKGLHKWSPLALLALLFFSILIAPVHASGTIIKVPQDYSTLQEAIENAPNDSVIIVSNGTYNVTGLVIHGKRNLTIIGEEGAVLEVNTSISGIQVIDSENITFENIIISASSRVPLNNDIFNLTSVRGFSLVNSDINGPSRYVVAVHDSSTRVKVVDDIFERGVWLAIVYGDTNASVVVENITVGKSNILVRGWGFESVTIRNVTLTGSNILFMLRSIENLAVVDVRTSETSELGHVNDVNLLVVRNVEAHGVLSAVRVGDAIVENLILTGGLLQIEAANASIVNVVLNNGILEVGLADKCRGTSNFILENIKIMNATVNSIPVLSGPSVIPGGPCSLYLVYKNISIEINSLESPAYALVHLGSNWNGSTIAKNIKIISHIDPGSSSIPVLEISNTLLENATITGVNSTGIRALFSTLENISVSSTGKPLSKAIVLEQSNATRITVDRALIGIEYSVLRKDSQGVIRNARINASIGLLLTSCESCRGASLEIRDGKFTVGKSFLEDLAPASLNITVEESRILGSPGSNASLMEDSIAGELKLNLSKVEITGLSLFPSLNSIPSRLYFNSVDTTIDGAVLTALSGASNKILDLRGLPAVVFLRNTVNVTLENFHSINIRPASIILLSARQTFLRNFTLLGKAYLAWSSITIEYMTAGNNSKLVFDNHTSANIYLSILASNTIQGKPTYVLLESPVVKYEYRGGIYTGRLGNYWLDLSDKLRDYNGDGLLDLKPVSTSSKLRDYWALASPPRQYRIVETLTKPPSISIIVYSAGNADIVEARAYNAYCIAKPAKLYVNNERVRTIVLLPRTWVKLGLKPGDKLGLECNNEWANTTVALPSGGGETGTTTSTKTTSFQPTSSSSKTAMSTRQSTSTNSPLTEPRSGWRPSGWRITTVSLVIVIAVAIAFFALARGRQ